jgi:hypothetical protein
MRSFATAAVAACVSATALAASTGPASDTGADLMAAGWAAVGVVAFLLLRHGLRRRAGRRER